MILIGSHGRLDNIDDEGRFIKDEAFEYQGKEVLTRAGTSARGLLKSWVQLRIQDERCRKMLEKIEVMQQPAGFCDGIIAKWRIESTAEFHAQSLHMRDLNSAYLSSSGRQAMFLSQQVACWVGGKMTPPFRSHRHCLSSLGSSKQSERGIEERIEEQGRRGRS